METGPTWGASSVAQAPWNPPCAPIWGSASTGIAPSDAASSDATNEHIRLPVDQHSIPAANGVQAQSSATSEGPDESSQSSLSSAEINQIIDSVVNSSAQITGIDRAASSDLGVASAQSGLSGAPEKERKSKSSGGKKKFKRRGSASSEQLEKQPKLSSADASGSTTTTTRATCESSVSSPTVTSNDRVHAKQTDNNASTCMDSPIANRTDATATSATDRPSSTNSNIRSSPPTLVATDSPASTNSNVRLSDFDDDAYLRSILDDSKPDVIAASSDSTAGPFVSPYSANVTSLNRVPDNSEDGRVGHWTDGTIRPPDPWICCYCGLEFPDHLLLKEHASKHPEYVPNKCYVCSKEFVCKAIGNHIDLVHRKLRNWKCDLCPKRYYANCDLERHKHQVHLKTPYRCTICSYLCHNDNTLREHYLGRHQCKIKFKVPYLPELSEIIPLTPEELSQRSASYKGGGGGGNSESAGSLQRVVMPIPLPPPNNLIDQKSDKNNGPTNSAKSNKKLSPATCTSMANANQSSSTLSISSLTSSSLPSASYSSLPPSTGGRRALIGHFSLPPDILNATNSTQASNPPLSDASQATSKNTSANNLSSKITSASNTSTSSESHTRVKSEPVESTMLNSLGDTASHRSSNPNASMLSTSSLSTSSSSTIPATMTVPSSGASSTKASTSDVVPSSSVPNLQTVDLNSRRPGAAFAYGGNIFQTAGQLAVDYSALQQPQQRHISDPNRHRGPQPSATPPVQVKSEPGLVDNPAASPHLSHGAAMHKVSIGGSAQIGHHAPTAYGVTRPGFAQHLQPPHHQQPLPQHHHQVPPQHHHRPPQQHHQPPPQRHPELTSCLPSTTGQSTSAQIKSEPGQLSQPFSPNHLAIPTQSIQRPVASSFPHQRLPLFSIGRSFAPPPPPPNPQSVRPPAPLYHLPVKQEPSFSYPSPFPGYAAATTSHSRFQTTALAPPPLAPAVPPPPPYCLPHYQPSSQSSNNALMQPSAVSRPETYSTQSAAYFGNSSFPGTSDHRHSLVNPGSVAPLPYIKPEPIDPEYGVSGMVAAGGNSASTGFASSSSRQQQPPPQPRACAPLPPSNPPQQQQPPPPPLVPQLPLQQVSRHQQQSGPNDVIVKQEATKSYDFIKLVLYDCMHCGQRYGHRGIVEFHLEKKHKVRKKDYHVTYMCKICDKPFPSESDLDEHLKKFH